MKTVFCLPLILTCLAVPVHAIGSESTDRFVAARPVWLEGRATEMNLTAGFRAVIERPDSGAVRLRLAAASIYRVYANGNFVGHGPARGPHGYYWIDEWDLSNRLYGLTE